MRKITLFISLLICLVYSSVTTADIQDDFLFSTSAHYKNILVKRVMSANIIVLENDEKIKLIGLKAPKVPKTKKYQERDQYGFVIEEENPLVTVEEQAFDFAQALLEGKYVRIEFDSQKKGDNYETLGYVFLIQDDTFANAKILSQGFAALQIRPPNLKYAERLRKAYREARREKRGLQGQ